MGFQQVVALTGDGYVPVGFALLDNLEHLLGTGDEPLCGALHERHSILVLMHGQVHLGNWEHTQITDTVIHGTYVNNAILVLMHRQVHLGNWNTHR